MIDPDLIERAHDAFVAEYARLSRPGDDEADHFDAQRAALEAVIALVQGESERYKATLRALVDAAPPYFHAALAGYGADRFREPYATALREAEAALDATSRAEAA